MIDQAQIRRSVFIDVARDARRSAANLRRMCGSYRSADGNACDQARADAHDEIATLLEALLTKEGT